MNLLSLLKHHRPIYTGTPDDQKIVCICSWHSVRGTDEDIWEEWIGHIIARALERKSELA